MPQPDAQKQDLPGEGLLPRMPKGSKYVQIVNSVTNGSDFIRRRTAEHFVADGRAEWIGDSQIKLVPHPKNEAAARQSTAWEAASDSSRVRPAWVKSSPSREVFKENLDAGRSVQCHKLNRNLSEQGFPSHRFNPDRMPQSRFGTEKEYRESIADKESR